MIMSGAGGGSPAAPRVGGNYPWRGLSSPGCTPSRVSLRTPIGPITTSRRSPLFAEGSAQEEF